MSRVQTLLKFPDSQTNSVSESCWLNHEWLKTRKENASGIEFCQASNAFTIGWFSLTWFLMKNKDLGPIGGPRSFYDSGPWWCAHNLKGVQKIPSSPSTARWVSRRPGPLLRALFLAQSSLLCWHWAWPRSLSVWAGLWWGSSLVSSSFFRVLRPS